MQDQNKIKKLLTFEQDANLAIFDELNELNDKIKELIEAVELSKQTEINISNPEDINLDLTPLEANFDTLKDSIESVTQSIKEKKDIDMSGVEKLLSKIANKETTIEITELSKLSEILGDILYAVQTTASTANLNPEKPEKLIPDLKTIQSILNVINKNISSLELPDFDYDKLGKTIKKNLNIKVNGGGGPGTVGLRNASDTTINPATEDKQDTLITNTTVGTIDTNNSSSTPLGISGVFTGTATDATNYSSIIITIKTDVASATDGLSVQFSVDGTNWDHIDPHSISANTSHSLTVAPQARYYRVVYTNGGTGQTYFRLQSLPRRSAVGPQMETLSGDVSDTNFAVTSRAVLSAKKPSGDYTNIGATTGGNLKVSIEEQDAGAGLATEAKQDSIVTAIQAIPSGGDATPYDTLIEEASATITYIGKAVAGTATSAASWQVKRINTASGTVIRYADGVSTFTKIWDNRATFSY